MNHFTTLRIEIPTVRQTTHSLNSELQEIEKQYDAIILHIPEEDKKRSQNTEVLILVNKKSSFVVIDKLEKISEKYDLGLNIEMSSGKNINKKQKNKYILYLLAPTISLTKLFEIIKCINSDFFNIQGITQIGNSTGSNSANHTSKSCFCLTLEGASENRPNMHFKLNRLASDLGIDFSLQPDNETSKSKKLICFDMDSTLIQTEVIDELAIRAGVGDEVKKITEHAMRGEIDFNASFKNRVALLKGLDESVMIEIINNLPLMDGLDRLMFTLKKLNYKIAILSGGFTYFASYLQQKYNIDYMYANQLEIKEGKLTGNYLGDIVDGQYKLERLKEIANNEQICIEQTIAVGDGANDLPMINAAGLGIAYRAKPKVQESAQHKINTVGIDGVLYFLGIDAHFHAETDEF